MKLWKIVAAILAAIAPVLVAIVKYAHKSDITKPTHSFSGFVSSTSGQAIGHARIRVFQDSTAGEPVYSDSDGSFAVQVSDDAKSLIITVTAEGYESYDGTEPVNRSTPAQIRAITYLTNQKQFAMIGPPFLGLVSLRDLLLETADPFVTIGRMFEGMMFGFRPVSNPMAVIEPSHVEDLLKQLGDLRDRSETMGMKSTTRSAVSAMEHFEKFKGHLLYLVVVQRAGELYRTFTEELEGQRFARIASERIKYFPAEDTAPFGIAVSDAFPDASFDICEAAKCLALETDTAAVLHCMRALEIALHGISSALGVAFERESWNTLLSQIESRIRAISTKQPRPDNWKEKEEAFSRVAKEFRYVKDAWRNHAMHARSKYTYPEALTVYNHTHELMKEAAACLA